MATLHIPYYKSDIPVVKYTGSINSGVMVIQPYQGNLMISGSLLDASNKYFNTTADHTQYIDILCKTSTGSVGSLQLPNKNNNFSWVITYSNNKYIWTNIEDIPLSKCITMSINGNMPVEITDNYKVFKYTNHYLYNVILDANIVIDIDTSNSIVKSGKNIFIIFNAGATSSTSVLNSFNKYAVNVTDTTKTNIHVNKFIPDIDTTNAPSFCLTLISAKMKSGVPDEIEVLKNVSINGTITITENLRYTATV